MNIIFPIAGLGTRFTQKGYQLPKPLILVNDKPIFEYAIESLKIDGHYIIAARFTSESHYDELEKIIKKIGISYEIQKINFETKGAAETALIATNSIKYKNDELIITNCDQYTPWDVKKFINFKNSNNLDCIVTIFDHGDIVLNQKSKYSFIEIDEKTGYGVRLAEKFAISKNALNGIHYWKNSESFIWSANELLKNQIDSEYYISLTFNKLIANNYKVGTYKMEKNEFYSLGTPDEVAIFEKIIKT